MNTQSCSAILPLFSRCLLPIPKDSYFTSLPPSFPDSLGGPLRRGHPFHTHTHTHTPSSSDDLISYFIDKIGSSYKGTPYLPTTPLNPSEFVFLFPSCLLIAMDEVSLLLPKDTPFTWELNPLVSCFSNSPISATVLPSLLHPQFLSLNSGHSQQNAYLFHHLHRLQSFSFTPCLPSADGLSPCCPSKQPFSRTCLLSLLPHLLFLLSPL